MNAPHGLHRHQYFQFNIANALFSETVLFFSHEMIKWGVLIQGWWYVHVLSLLTSMCTYYMQPLEVHAHMHKFIKFRGCLEAASERPTYLLALHLHGPRFTTPDKMQGSKSVKQHATMNNFQLYFKRGKKKSFILSLRNSEICLYEI